MTGEEIKMAKVLSRKLAAADDPIYKESWSVFTYRRPRNSIDTTLGNTDGEAQEKNAECMASTEVKPKVDKKTIKTKKDEVDAALALMSNFLHISRRKNLFDSDALALLSEFLLITKQRSLFENEPDDCKNVKAKISRQGILFDEAPDI